MVRSRLDLVRDWFKEQWKQYQKINRIKLNGYDPHEVAQKHNEYVAAIADAKRYRWLRDNGHLDKWWSVEGPNDRCTNIDNDIDVAMFEELLDEYYPDDVDVRPAECRFRLHEEGKAYPRSGCNACKKNIWEPCLYDKNSNGPINESGHV